MPEPEKPEDKKQGDEKDGKGAAGRLAAEHKAASPSAVEKLKERVARAEKKKKKPEGPRRRRLSDEERKALWHKAVIRKARKLKIMTDLLLLFTLALVIGVHFVPFAPFVGGVGGDDVWRPKTGYEIMRRLVEEGGRPWIETKRDEAGREVADRATGSVIRVFHREANADLLAYFILAVPAGAALLVLLYLLDYLIWFGRPLPGLSALWGFGSVGYLIYVRVPRDSTWEMLGYNAMLAWYLLLVPLFLVGAVSVLRFVVSQRWKRYEFAGLPVPGHLKPKPPEEPAKAEKAKKAGKAGEPAKAGESKGPSETSEGKEAQKPKEDEGQAAEKAENSDKPGEGG